MLLLFVATVWKTQKSPLLLMNRAPLIPGYLFWNMDEKPRGGEGYKDGCWTPIREGLSLVSRQSGERGGETRSILVNIQRETLVSQWQHTFVMPVCCHGNISRASGQECHACAQSLTISQWREELSSEECDGVKLGVNQPSISDVSAMWGNTTHCVHYSSVLLEMNSI